MNTGDLNEFLYENDLAERGDDPVWTPLAGGVSSDIWRVDLKNRTLCVKRALAKLKVAADWSAPTIRNNYEWKWFRFVHENFPGVVPRPVVHDKKRRMLAMEFLDPAVYRVWKKDLLNGKADAEFAATVGRFLGRIHAKSAFDKEIERRFATDELFYALRIEPYLLATAGKHPELKPSIEKIAAAVLEKKIALVHGDVSPKNIMIGEKLPVFLDAETAWFGDPAFDPAFCLNHFLLKAVYLPEKAGEFIECLVTLMQNYLNEVNWEEQREIEARTARLLPVLFLARVDGKSPVEYITDESMKKRIRKIAAEFIRRPAETVSEIGGRVRKP